MMAAEHLAPMKILTQAEITAELTFLLTLPHPRLPFSLLFHSTSKKT